MPVKHAVKTAIAALISILYYRFLGLPEGYWAVLSAVIVMQANVGGSFKASGSRFLGTAIGALLGVIGVTLLGKSAGAVAIVLMLTILLCAYLKLEESYRLASVTVAIVMLAGGSEPLLFGFQRFLDVSVGILIALLVSIVVLPSRAKVYLQQGIAQVLLDCGQLYQILTTSYLSGTYPEEAIAELRSSIKQKFRKNRALLSDHLQEPGITALNQQHLIGLINDEERIIEHVMAIDEAVRNVEADHFHLNLPQLPELIQATAIAFSQLATAATAQKPLRQPLELDPVLAAIDKQLLALRQAGISRQHSLEEMIRFYAFFYSLKELAADLKKLAAKLNTSDIDFPVTTLAQSTHGFFKPR
jgi:uncharacterized membrane protein YccC